MKKKIILMIVSFILVFGVTGCNQVEEENQNRNSSTLENSSSSMLENSSAALEENPYVVVISSKDFFAKVNAKESFTVAVVQDGCGACNAFKPIYHEIAKNEKMTVYEINLTTDERENAVTLIDDWGITHTPTTLHIQNGKEENRLIGYQSEDSIHSFMKK